MQVGGWEGYDERGQMADVGEFAQGGEAALERGRRWVRIRKAVQRPLRCTDHRRRAENSLEESATEIASQSGLPGGTTIG